MTSGEPIRLKRDCAGVMIPSGVTVKLTAGSAVWVTQTLGGNYSVMTDRGYVVRISGQDADALGIQGAVEVKPGSAVQMKDRAEIEKAVWERLKSCFDPEIPVNIVDLGLIYHCEVVPLREKSYRAEVRFTLTARGCGMGEALKADIKKKLSTIPGVQEIHVELVWDPPWHQGRMSGEAKVQLGMV